VPTHVPTHVPIYVPIYVLIYVLTVLRTIRPARCVGSPIPRDGRRTALQVLATGLLTCLLALPAASDPTGSEAGTPGSLDTDLLRQLDEAAERDREAREAEREAARRAQAERASAREAEVRRARAAERATSAPLERALADEQARQAELLETVRGEGDGDGPVPPPPDDPAFADPRVAARPPSPRALPDEIFDRSNAVIPPGTWGNREPLRVERLVLDADGDGRPELVRFVDRATGELVREEQDRNYDGVLDAWLRFEDGAVASRTLDGNDDGNPDVFETYRDGRVAVRELDRDDDGVRDVFYRYDGDSLVEERHDANNDGVIDLVIVYADRLRVRAEEDVDRDGRMDVWTRYTTEDGRERVARIDRDTRGAGIADTSEIFRVEDGSSVLVRREHDVDTDGRVDVVSFYEGGRLRRRQIRDADVVSRTAPGVSDG